MLIIIFGVVAAGLLLFAVIDFSQKPVFTVDAGGGLVDLKTQVPLEIGQHIPGNGFVHARDGGAVLSHEGTILTMQPNSDVQIKQISDELVSFFSTRGQFSVEPDRTIEICTRATCIATADSVEINYITPGEIVEISPEGEATVLYKKAELHHVEAGGFIRVDELSGEITFTP